MTDRERARWRITVTALLISIAGWAFHLAAPAHRPVPSFCWGSTAAGPWPSLQALLQVHPPASLATNWLLMLFAMMVPTLVAPVLHVQQRSFRHRRARAIGIFALSYLAVWMLAGAGLTYLQLMLNVASPQSLWPAAVTALIALVWQCSPAKQLCLNRSHGHSALAAFGWAADRDALRFGLSHGLWCVGSCWALMLMPLLLIHGHTAAMLAMTVLMVAERLEGPRPLGWQLRGLGKLVRIASAQVRPLRSHLRS